MKIILDKYSCTVIKEKGDTHFSGVKNAAGESRLLHHIKNILNSNGFYFVKKRMCKDGHLVSGLQQYLRVKNPQNNGVQCIWNSSWSINGADECLNEYGQVVLQIEWGYATPKDVINKFHHII